MKTFLTNEKIGALKALLSPHVYSEEVNKEIHRYPKQTVIGLGQGGGRIAAELSRFGFPTYIVNSSKSDMDEHSNLIPEDRRIVTSSKEFPELEGTDKNALVGFEIAKENKEIYKKIALSDDVVNAEFVWVSVSLGGGTGNGALKVALAYLSKVRENRSLPGGKIPLGVICSLPSKDERGSAFRKNALAGIALIQQMINEKKIGSVIVIDNEKMNDYYTQKPLVTRGGLEIDAKTYSNMVVASILAEVSTLPLINGRSVYDKTEFLGTISTPGWLSISKYTELRSDSNVEETIKKLFSDNEVLATYKGESAITGAVAALYPASRNISPQIADDVYKFTSEYLDTKVNHAIARISSIENLTLYGLAVYPTPPSRITELKTELQDWEIKEKEQEEAKQKASSELGLDEFSSFFNQSSNLLRKKTTFDDFEDPFETETVPSDDNKIKAVNLDDIDF